MNTAAFLIDALLYVLAGATLLVIGFKTVHLWMPNLLGKPAWSTRMGNSETDLSEALDDMESGLTVLAVIASAAPFVGLAGTVLHIMDALRAMGGSASDFSVITGPIVTALNATLWGLAAAIPAATAHVFFQRRVQLVENRQRRNLAAGQQGS